MLYRIDIWQTNPRPITPTISALPDDPDKRGQSWRQPPAGTDLYIGQSLPFIVAKATQIPGESD